ncbi:hypothetical protein K8I28_01390 [bacterium]|nr:hypothetical protein [bacterium]
MDGKNILKSVIAILVVTSTAMAGESLSSKYPVTFYGFIRAEAVFDNSEVAQGDWLLFARPESSAEADQSVFTMNARHTRVGFKIGGPAFQDDGQIRALLEVDFAGGFPNSSTAARQPQLRLRHAWIELDKSSWSLRFGQDWALISGPFPSTASFVVGAGKGNLWMRYPQLKYTVKSDPFKFSCSINRPMAGNTKYNDFTGGDFDPVGDGERSGLPWLMARMWYNMSGFTASFGGHYGQEKINDLSGKDHVTGSYSIVGDIGIKLEKVELTAKGFYGENLNSFFGGVFQGFSKDSLAVTNISSVGGWAQLKYHLTKTYTATIGGGVDDPDDSDLNHIDPVEEAKMRTMNSWLFANVGYTISEGLTCLFETNFLETSYKNGESGNNLRFMFVTTFKF